MACCNCAEGRDQLMNVLSMIGVKTRRVSSPIEGGQAISYHPVTADVAQW
jgi:hypothetical protein